MPNPEAPVACLLSFPIYVTVSVIFRRGSQRFHVHKTPDGANLLCFRTLPPSDGRFSSFNLFFCLLRQSSRLFRLFSCSARNVPPYLTLIRRPTINMPREPQNKERPPPPAPQHRAQLIGDLLAREYMHASVEWKKQSYETLFGTLCYDSAREDNYRMRLLRLFSIEYRWIGGVGHRYVNITLDSEDIGYLKSHDMSMTFLETDASQVINQLMPSKKRTMNCRFRISWCWSSLTCLF